MTDLTDRTTDPRDEPTQLVDRVRPPRRSA